ncbi:hypothetical protein C8Q76DRAFT_582967, partial [Earliella scabrosa]
AIWHIFDREDTARVRQALRALGLCSTDVDPIHSQSVYLGEKDLAAMVDRFKVRPWTIRQRVGDLIVVPAGSLHQVWNLQGAIKVASDFISATNLPWTARMLTEWRE